MSYLVISFSHKNTDIQTREKLAFPSEENKDRFLKQILEDDLVDEAILLSTCNRVEIVTSVINTDLAAKAIIKKLSTYSGIDFAAILVFKTDVIISTLLHVDKSIASSTVSSSKICFKNLSLFSSLGNASFSLV